MRRSRPDKGVFASLGRVIDDVGEQTRRRLPDLREPAGRVLEIGRGAARQTASMIMPAERSRRRRRAQPLSMRRAPAARTGARRRRAPAAKNARRRS